MAVGGGIEPLSSVRLLLRYWFRRQVPGHRLLYTNLETVLYPAELRVKMARPERFEPPTYCLEGNCYCPAELRTQNIGGTAGIRTRDC